MFHSLPQARLLFALGAVVAAGGLAAAEGGTSAHICPVVNTPSVNTPSKLDYIVLASLVDSPHLLSMAGYRSTARERVILPDGEFAPDAKPPAGVGRP